MFTLSAPFETLTEIKKSKFITHAAPVDSKEAALLFLARVKDESATHNCWAYKIGAEYRFSDDGEPGGTAGKPILSAIEGGEVDRVMVVVTRFFGGIKLGAGGLVRAYANAASTCLGRAEKHKIIVRTDVGFQIPFDAIGCVYPLLDKFDAVKLTETYTDTSVVFLIQLPMDNKVRFETELVDATYGKVVVSRAMD